MPYGIANKMGQVEELEVAAILDLAWESGVNSMDTAKQYGTCEEVIGAYLKNNLSGWEFWLLSGNPLLTKYLKMKASLKIPVSNGGIDCRWIKYLIR